MNEDEFYFDEDQSLDPTPDEIEQELAELSEMETKELARLALKEAKEAERQAVLIKYKQEWQEEYGIDPTKSELWKLGREREIKKRYGGLEQMLESKKADFLARQEAKKPERAARTIQRTLRRSILCQPCENLDTVQQKQIDPLRLIRLTVDDHCVCYDVVKLYQNLSQKYGTDVQALWRWRDPTYDIRFSPAQSKRIKNQWAKVRPEGHALARTETDIALSKMTKPMVK